MIFNLSIRRTFYRTKSESKVHIDNKSNFFHNEILKFLKLNSEGETRGNF